MKYPKISSSKPKAYLYEDFSLGLGAPKSVLENCNNFYYFNGKFTTRKTLSTSENDIIHTTINAQSANFELTDSTIFLNGEYHRVGIIITTDEMSYTDYNFVFISHNSEHINAGNIRFSRVSSSEFNRPRSIMVFSGEPTNGKGIYAFIDVNTPNGDNVLQIYELNYNMSHWYRIEQEDTYIPDYYINGRGTMYGESEETYPTPQFKEPINMLNPKYNCYFTSDGVSSAFVLPTKQMSLSDTDGLDIFLSLPNGQKYVWNINGKSLISDEKVVGEYSVWVSFNALSGGLTFMSSPSGFVPPRSEGLTNNLKVTVKNFNKSYHDRIAGMKKALWYGTGNSGSRLCITGNDSFPSLVLISQKDQSLYFPDTNQFFVGDPAQRVTALARQNKSIIMFKEKEIYSAYYTSGNFAITNIHSSVGCDLPHTVSLCDNRLVWTNLNGEVYMLSSLSQYSATAVYKLSNNISSILKGENRDDMTMACACTDNDKYMLFIKNRAYVMDYHAAIKKSTSSFISSVAWYRWTFPLPINITASFAFDKGVTLVCNTASQKHYCHYLSRLDSDDRCDKIFYALSEEDFVIKSEPVLSTIETVLLDGDSPEQNKLYTDLYLRLFAEEDVHIDYRSCDGDILKSAVINIEYNRVKLPKAYRLLPLIRSPQLKLCVSFRGAAEFEGLVFYINKLSKMH